MKKLILLKVKIIIGIVLFIVLICAGYSATLFHTTANIKYSDEEGKQGDFIYKGKFLVPVQNFIKVTSKFGKREAHGVVSSNHTGIDLCGTLGSKVMAVKVGEVTWAGWQDNGYGNCVEIKHTDANGEIFYTFYAHMRDNSICVTKGELVNEGQFIGTQGTTGNSTGDHLHFEIRTSSGSNRYAIDPAPYLFDEV